MFYGECLYRQGWWVRKFATEQEAINWCALQQLAEMNAANPVTIIRISPAVKLRRIEY